MGFAKRECAAYFCRPYRSEGSIIARSRKKDVSHLAKQQHDKVEEMAFRKALLVFARGSGGRDRRVAARSTLDGPYVDAADEIANEHQKKRNPL